MDTPKPKSNAAAEPACALEQWPPAQAYLINAFTSALAFNTNMTVEDIAYLTLVFLRGILETTADPDIVAQCKTLFEESADTRDYLGRVLRAQAALHQRQSVPGAGAASERRH